MLMLTCLEKKKGRDSRTCEDVNGNGQHTVTLASNKSAGDHLFTYYLLFIYLFIYSLHTWCDSNDE